MKKLLLLLIMLTFGVSCQEKASKNSDVQLLNGYWEIEEVTLADGAKVSYKINEDLDFFEVKNDSGFRKKVKPQFNGTYLVNDTYEKIKIDRDAKGTFIRYQTKYATWKEQIISLSKEQLILENEQNVQYQYKKPVYFTVK